MSAWRWNGLVQTRRVGTPTRKAVLMFLADAADEAGRSFWGIGTMAGVLELGEKTIRRALSTFEADGLLTRYRDRRADGTLAQYHYQLDWDAIAALPWNGTQGGADGFDPFAPRRIPVPHLGKPAVTATGSGADHRSPSPAPPVTESQTTGHRDRAEPPEDQPKEDQPQREAPPTSGGPSPTAPAQLSLVAQDATQDQAKLAEERFEQHFWPVYPKRHGRRSNKAEALALWRKLSTADQRAAVHGARAYAAFCQRTETYAQDPDRWLRRRRWEEQDQPAAPEAPPVVSVAPAMGLPNGGRRTMSDEDVARMREQVQQQLAAADAQQGTVQGIPR